MQVEGFFDWLGHALGTVIRWIVDGLSGVLHLIGNAGSQFLHGLSGALGITPSLLSIVALIIGLLFLYSAVRAFMRRSVVLGIIWLLLGLWLISLLIS
jgi:divalent metal cation (Fe/Co/Zn/Cd) transporter